MTDGVHRAGKRGLRHRRHRLLQHPFFFFRCRPWFWRRLHGDRCRAVSAIADRADAEPVLDVAGEIAHCVAPRRRIAARHVGPYVGVGVVFRPVGPNRFTCGRLTCAHALLILPLLDAGIRGKRPRQRNPPCARLCGQYRRRRRPRRCGKLVVAIWAEFVVCRHCTNAVAILDAVGERSALKFLGALVAGDNVGPGSGPSGIANLLLVLPFHDAGFVVGLVVPDELDLCVARLQLETRRLAGVLSGVTEAESLDIVPSPPTVTARILKV